MVIPNVRSGLVPYFERELEGRWSASNASQRKRGREWYPVALNWAEGLSERSGYSVEQVVGVMATTSPRTQLITNIRWTERAVLSRGRIKVGMFPNRMQAKYKQILDNPEFAHDYITGPKVSNFYKNILGNTKLVTVDRWAINAVLQYTERNDNNLKFGKGKVINSIAQAYANVAKRHSICARDFQAVIWLQVRESMVDSRGRKITLKNLEEILNG